MNVFQGFFPPYKLHPIPLQYQVHGHLLGRGLSWVEFTSTSAQSVVWRVIRWVGNDKSAKDEPPA